MPNIFKKADWLLIAGALAAAALLLAATSVGGAREGLYAAVYVDGKFYASVPLTDKTETIDIITGYGSNTITVYPDGAAVTDADCPNGDCVRAGRIGGLNASVACLPHRLLLRLESDAERGVDAVAK